MVQQLKALDEIISPSRLWHSLLLKSAWREKRRMEGEIMKAGEAVICQKCIHLRKWHTSVGKRMDRMKCKCVCVCVMNEGEE